MNHIAISTPEKVSDPHWPPTNIRSNHHGERSCNISNITFYQPPSVAPRATSPSIVATRTDHRRRTRMRRNTHGLGAYLGSLVPSASRHPKEFDATTGKRRCQQNVSGIMCRRRCGIRSLSRQYHISRAKECHSSPILTLVGKYLGESERKVLAIFGFST